MTQDTPHDVDARHAAILASLQKKERGLKLRIGLAVVCFVVFVVLNISAVLNQVIDQRAPLLFGLLIGSILLLPRQVLSRALIEQLTGTPLHQEWVERLSRIQIWMVWTRAGFFFVAMFLFLGLPKLI